MGFIVVCGFLIGYVSTNICRALGFNPFTWQAWTTCVVLSLLANIIAHLLGVALR